MKRILGAAILVAAVFSGGCGGAADNTPAWFSGTFEEALASASARGTMVMLDFYSPN
jgi:hypothetical protein